MCEIIIQFGTMYLRNLFIPSKCNIHFNVNFSNHLIFLKCLKFISSFPMYIIHFHLHVNVAVDHLYIF